MALSFSLKYRKSDNARMLAAALLQVSRALGAATIAWLLADMLNLPQPQWAAISALVVVQETLGTTVRAGRNRIAATGLGAAAGALAGVAHLHGMPVYAACALALLPAVALANRSRDFRTAPIAAIIVLSTAISHGSPMMVALLRMGEITLGAVTGIVVLRWMLPVSTGENMRHRAVELLDALSSSATDIGSASIDAGATNDGRTARIRACILDLMLMARGAQHEPVSGRTKTIEFAISLRRLNEDLSFVARVCAQAKKRTQTKDLTLEQLGPALQQALQQTQRRLAGADGLWQPLDIDALVPWATPDSDRPQLLETIAALRFGLGSIQRQLAIIAETANSSIG